MANLRREKADLQKEVERLRKENDVLLRVQAVHPGRGRTAPAPPAAAGAAALGGADAPAVPSASDTSRAVAPFG